MGGFVCPGQRRTALHRSGRPPVLMRLRLPPEHARGERPRRRPISRSPTTIRLRARRVSAATIPAFHGRGTHMVTRRIGVIGSGEVGETLANGFLKHGYEV